MKSFQQFNEDIHSLKRDLSAIERQEAPKANLLLRRKRALDIAKSAGDEFNRRSSEKIKTKKEDQ